MRVKKFGSLLYAIFLRDFWLKLTALGIAIFLWWSHSAPQ